MRPLLCLMVLLMLAPVGAQEVKPGMVSYMLTTEAITDPDPAEPRDRVLLFIEGDAAREIFAAMTVKPAKTDCMGETVPKGEVLKKAGKLECTFDGKDDYRCSVGLMLKTGATTEGYVCD